jgi:hypothetical protein
MSCNEDHFSQAETPPPANGPLANEFGDDSTSDAVNVVLNGEWTPAYPLTELHLLLTEPRQPYTVSLAHQDSTS